MVSKRIMTILIVCLIMMGSVLSIYVFHLPPMVSPWTIETVDDAANVGETSSIAVDSQNLPHISYYDAQFTRLKYASRSGEGWECEVVLDEDLWTGSDSIISLNQDEAEIFSNHDQNCEIVYSNREDGNWSGVYLGLHSFEFELDQDSAGIYFVIFRNAGAGGAIFTFDGDEQDIFTGYDELPMRMRWPDIAIDQKDIIHVTYLETIIWNQTNFYEVKYGTYSNGQWDFMAVDNMTMWTEDLEHQTFGKPVLELDSKGLPHVCYYDQRIDGYKHAYISSDRWITEIVPENLSSGFSMALNSDDNLYIATFNESERDLVLVSKIGGKWYNKTLDRGGVVGTSPSIAIDSDDCLHISYYDESNGNLKYAHMTSQDSTIPMVIDMGVFIALFISLFLFRRAPGKKGNKGLEEGETCKNENSHTE